MTRHRVAWFVATVPVLSLAVIEAVIVSNLLPPKAEAAGRNNVVPWLIAWALMSTAILAAITIAVVLVSAGVRTQGRSHEREGGLLQSDNSTHNRD